MLYYLGLCGLFASGFFLAVLLCAVMSATRNADHDMRVQKMNAETELWRGKYELCYARAEDLEAELRGANAALVVLRKELAAFSTNEKVRDGTD